MPFKNVLRFLSNRGWSGPGGGGPSTNSNGADQQQQQRWHRAELIPAGGGGGGGILRVHSSSGTVYDGNQQYTLSNQKVPNRSVSHLNADHTGIVDAPIAAPLAKPEPLADLDKPAIDSRQYSKQATTITLSSVPGSADRGGFYGSGYVYDYVPKHHRAIKFADEDNDDDDDPGVMSEAETSATSGTNSYVRRRQVGGGGHSSSYGASGQPHAWHMSMQRGGGGGANASSPKFARLGSELINGYSVPILSGPERKSGVVFVQYQGETKRAVLPVDPSGEYSSTKSNSALRTLDDARSLFAKAFPTELPLEYLRSTNVKIYIQDISKADFFYELDDLSDVKDRSVLRLHEPSSSTRPNSPPPPPTQPLPSTPDSQQAGAAGGGSPSINGGYNRHHRQQSNEEDMSYFSEPEFDASGEYRLQKSASANNYYGGINAAYQQHKRHYGTIDRVYGYGGGETGGGPRAYHEPSSAMTGPPKPERHFGPGIPSGGRSSVRGSNTFIGPPPHRRGSDITAAGGQQQQHPYNPTAEQDEAYTRIGYRDYAASPTTEAAVDAIYQQRPRPASRSGSATPVIDEEARVRMMNMEKQLANLSNLVHSALMSKGVSETVYKDLEMLRKEIFGSGGPPSSSGGTRDDVSDSGSISRFSDLSSDKGSYQSNSDKPTPPQFVGHSSSADGNSSTTTSAPLSPVTVGANGGASNNGIDPNCITTSVTAAISLTPTSLHFTPDARLSLRNAKRRVTEVQSELKNLRRMAQLNAQCSRDILKDAFDRIKVILNTNKHLHMFAAQAQQQNMAEMAALTGDRKWTNQEEERYRTETRRVEKGLSSLEREVEELRQRVVNGERKLRMSEVESFTDNLTQIGRSAAGLKNNFPNLEGRLRNVMSTDMEKVVREEKFLKEEPTRLDNALKRCKKLANTMVTMKKLAMVQDPSAFYNNSKRPPLPTKSNASSDFEGNSSGAMSPTPYGDQRRSPPRALVNGGGGPNSPRTPTGHVLDNLLEELQTVAIHKNGGKTNGGDHEKRVGFADEIRVMHRDTNNESGGSDTIKRAPKPLTTSTPIHDESSGVSSILRSSIANYSHTQNRQQQQSLLSAGPPERRSASPSSMANSFRAAIPFLHSGRLGATTTVVRPPNSIGSEPAIYRQDPQFGFQQPPPPPPPPRSSSRNAVGGGSGQASPKASSDIVSPSPVPSTMSYRSEFEKKQRFFSNGSGNGEYTKIVVGTPTAIVQTNAVDDDTSARYVKSASSSESVNSQDGQRRRLFASMEPEKPPPPPPPRNKQEMLEQRQQELMSKQGQNRFVKFQLPD